MKLADRIARFVLTTDRSCERIVLRWKIAKAEYRVGATNAAYITAPPITDRLTQAYENVAWTQRKLAIEELPKLQARLKELS